MRESHIDDVPAASFYHDGLLLLGEQVTEFRRQILISHYQSTNHRATASQLAALTGQRHHSAINSGYGGLGRAFCKATGFVPPLRDDGTARWWTVWSKGYSLPDRFIWEMHENVAAALELLGWVDSSAPPLIPDEMPAKGTYKEGSRVEILVSAYERNRSARDACLQHYGYDCVACGFNFRSAYGEAGEGFIHVHHVTPLCEVGKSYVVDPINDLRPV